MESRVGIIMGSDSDLPVMQKAADALESLGVGFELTVVSAHRTPERMFDYAKNAESRGLRVIIAGAGGAAHLPGMVAALLPHCLEKDNPSQTNPACIVANHKFLEGLDL